MTDQENQYHRNIINITSKCSGVSLRAINCGNNEITVMFIKQLTDLVMLSNFIIKPIIENEKSLPTLSADKVAGRIITSEVNILKADETLITENLLNGMTVILLSWDENFITTNIKDFEKKSIDAPELTYTIRGPKDCFTENMDVNLSLIRYRIKDPELKISKLKVGRRTQAQVAVVYINDIANERIVNDIIQRISSIDIDGIIESGELQSMIQNPKRSLFPQIGLVERSDMACGGLLEGKVIIITEGSGIALIAPKTLAEFLWSADDNYDHKYLAILIKLLRICCLLFSFTLGSLYIALTSFHTDILPADYILTLAKLRANVPFNAFTTIFLLELIVEILREALLRVPKQIGSAIGIVGAIIIGQAAITSNIFDPLSLIIVSLSFLASFALPDYTIMNPFRLLKFFLMISTAILGIFGFTISFCIILSFVISVDSFGVPYLAPFSPFNLHDSFKSIFYDKKHTPNRPDFLQTKDKNRGKGRL